MGSCRWRHRSLQYVTAGPDNLIYPKNGELIPRFPKLADLPDLITVVQGTSGPDRHSSGLYLHPNPLIESVVTRYRVGWRGSSLGRAARITN